MSIFLEGLSMWNMLSCAEQEEIQKYKTHSYKTLKTEGVQIIMLKHPAKQLEKKTKHTHKKTPKKQPQNQTKTKQNKQKNPHKTQLLSQRTHK